MTQIANIGKLNTDSRDDIAKELFCKVLKLKMGEELVINTSVMSRTYQRVV